VRDSPIRDESTAHMIPSECARRRTFAIISHPDAGKTTLTEKFLLYGGAIQLAGAVTARKNQRAVTSDWMELERQRGISVTSTVLQFDYLGYRVNMLDTPGHKDFSDDTYRVLMAVDAVVMVIDAAKGIETQTRKLFEICRRRGVPIFTFMNKLDRPAKDALELLDELERVLGIHSYAMNWPLGSGVEFRGVLDRRERQLHLFEKVPGGAFRAPVEVHGIDDHAVKEKLGPDLHAKVTEELAMLDAAGGVFDEGEIHKGNLTPVFFGSAANNFGVQLLLDGFLRHALPPQPRRSGDRVIPLEHPAFSGFVFKIQANMDPKHRDRIAFVRICSGKFERDMAVTHVQSGKKVRLSSSHKLMGRDRETVDEGWPGDVVGFVGHEEFGIGDTLSEDPSILYREIPRFTPEHFTYIHSTSTSQFKRFREGLEQLLQEGVIQAFHLRDSNSRVPLLGAVGPLQAEVVQYRLQSEYGADSRLEPSRFEVLRWVPASVEATALDEALRYSNAALALDENGQRALLFPDQWAIRYFEKEHPSIELSALPLELVVEKKK
jgi:peptide chain release factor 3